MKLRCILFLMLLALPAAAKKRDWQVGTLVAIQYGTEPGASVVVAPSGDPTNLGAMMAAAAATPTRYQGMAIQGKDYGYVLIRRIIRGHPNVTINGPIKYAVEKGKVYTLDDDGKEWTWSVLEKRKP